jgi:hypothetical protein
MWISLLVRQDLGRLIFQDIMAFGDDNSNEILLVVLVEPNNFQTSPKVICSRGKKTGYRYTLIQDMGQGPRNCVTTPVGM